VATMASGDAASTSSGMISGTGLAMAKTTGRSFMEATISRSTMSPTERPTKTSAPSMASARVLSSVSRANCAL